MNSIFRVLQVLGFFIAGSFAGLNAAQDVLLLTGQISSLNKQVVLAPKGERWQVQIKWLAEEGKIVEVGEPVAIFDGSSIQSQLDTNLESLATLTLELKKLEMELAQRVLEAEGALEIARLRIEQAKIQASIPVGQISAYEKGGYEVALQEKLFELFKAQEELKLSKTSKVSELEKKRLELTLTQEDIAFQQEQLKAMSVVAKTSGPVSYAMHPWKGEKIDAGMNVRASWKIMEVRAAEEFVIESWVHEIDVRTIDEGDTVDVIFDSYPDQRYKALLVDKSTQSEVRHQWSNSVYYPLLFDITEKPEFELLPGMSLRIEVINETL